MNRQFSRTELVAGLTTLLSSLYIVITMPLILSAVGFPAANVMYATCIATAVATCWLGYRTNLPLMMGPGLALATFIATELMIHLKLPVDQALGLVIISGLGVFLLTRFGALTRLERTLPKSLIQATTLGIGLLLLVISIKLSQIIHWSPSFVINPFNLTGWICTTGLIFILNYKKIPGGTLLGIVSAALLTNLIQGQHQQSMTLPSSDELKLIIPNFEALLHLKGLFAVGSLILVSFIDTTASLHALLDHSRLTHNEPISKTKQCLKITGLTTSLSGLLNGSPMNIYLESAAGIFAGGTNRWTAFIVALGFLFSMFFISFVQYIPHFAAGGALTYVSIQMIKPIKNLPWHEWDKLLPALLTIAIIPLTLSIANGVGAGFIAYACINIYQRNTIPKENTFLIAIFAVYFCATILI